MINEILLSMIMACNYVVSKERESCHAYVVTCYYLESKNTKVLEKIEDKCYKRVAQIYTFEGVPNIPEIPDIDYGPY